MDVLHIACLFTVRPPFFSIGLFFFTFLFRFSISLRPDPCVYPNIFKAPQLVIPQCVNSSSVLVSGCYFVEIS